MGWDVADSNAKIKTTSENVGKKLPYPGLDHRDLLVERERVEQRASEDADRVGGGGARSSRLPRRAAVGRTPSHLDAEAGGLIDSDLEVLLVVGELEAELDRAGVHEVELVCIDLYGRRVPREVVKAILVEHRRGVEGLELGAGVGVERDQRQGRAVRVARGAVAGDVLEAERDGLDGVPSGKDPAVKNGHGGLARTAGADVIRRAGFGPHGGHNRRPANRAQGRGVGRHRGAGRAVRDELRGLAGAEAPAELEPHLRVEAESDGTRALALGLDDSAVGDGLAVERGTGGPPGHPDRDRDGLKTGIGHTIGLRAPTSTQ